jgi:hypothetical protein
VTNQASVTGGGTGSATAADTTVISYATYLVGDVFPYTGDNVGNFGDGSINTLDLISTLRAVVNLSGYVPATCSDRFDAMDAFPVDTENTRGGDGILNTLDLIEILKRAVNIDTSRPIRASRGLCSAPPGTEEPQKNRGKARPASRSQTAAGSLELQPAGLASDGWQRRAIYLGANTDLNLAGLSLSLGFVNAPVGAQLRFVAAEQPPSISDTGISGVLALAWLNGWTARADQRVLLGYVETSTGAALLQFQGASANAAGDGQDINLSFGAAHQ